LIRNRRVEMIKYFIYHLLFGGSLSRERELNALLREHMACFEVGQDYARIVDTSYGVAELAETFK
jgi:hypothetical protein